MNWFEHLAIQRKRKEIATLIKSLAADYTQLQDISDLPILKFDSPTEKQNFDSSPPSKKSKTSVKPMRMDSVGSKQSKLPSFSKTLSSSLKLEGEKSTFIQTYRDSDYSLKLESSLSSDEGLFHDVLGSKKKWQGLTEKYSSKLKDRSFSIYPMGKPNSETNSSMHDYSSAEVELPQASSSEDDGSYKSPLRVNKQSLNRTYEASKSKSTLRSQDQSFDSSSSVASSVSSCGGPYSPYSERAYKKVSFLEFVFIYYTKMIIYFFF